jgi:hypothetical protein
LVQLGGRRSLKHGTRFHIHLRGFFSSIAASVAAAVIPPTATSREFLSASFSRLAFVL